MGLNLSNEQITNELDVNPSDVQQMTTHLREGIVKKTRVAKSTLHRNTWWSLSSFIESLQR